MIRSDILVLIIGCSIVTWLPRILPFTLAQRLNFPKKVDIFLSYLPICILLALLVQSLLVFRSGHFPTIKVAETIACIPAVLVGYYTKDLMKIVIIGVVGIALLRLIM